MTIYCPRCAPNWIERRDSLPVPAMNLTAEQREALELLSSNPRGTTEDLLVLAHGFDSDMVAGLVDAGLATARRETLKAGDRTINVVRIRITKEGRNAIEG